SPRRRRGEQPPRARTMRTRATALAITIAALAAAPAAATSRRLQVSPSAVHRGGTARVHGSLPGCPRGDDVTLISRAFGGHGSFAGVPAVYARMGAGGVYSTRVRIPHRRAP